MTRKMLTAWIVVFLAWMAGSFIVHGTLLREGYASLPQLFRPEAEAGRYFPIMILAHVILAGAFVWIYTRGIQSTPWPGQGVRYGLAIAMLTAVPMYLIYYVVQPMPGTFVVQQIVFDTILLVLLGVLVAWLYRGPRTA